MSRVAVTLLLISLLPACGRVERLDPGESEPDELDTTRHGLCSSLGDLDEREIVLAGMSGTRLGLLRADGTSSLSEPLLDGDQARVRVSDNQEFALVSLVTNDPEASQLQVTVYDIQNHGVLWRYSAEGSRYASYFFASISDDGSASLTWDSQIIDVAQDGDATARASAPGLGVDEADAEGWVPHRVWAPDPEAAYHSFFENELTEERRELSHPVLARQRFPIYSDRAFWYFAELEGEFKLVRETVVETTLWDTSVASDELASFSQDGRWLFVKLAGAVVWGLDTARLGAKSYPHLEAASEGHWVTHLTDTHAVFTDQNLPRYRLDLETGELSPIQMIGGAATRYVVAKADWLLGVGTVGPTWRANARTGQAQAFDLAWLADYVDWPISHCDRLREATPTSAVRLLEDGSVAFALRDEKRAAAYHSSLELDQWEQVGDAYTGVQVVLADRRGPTWIVEGVYTDSTYTYCPFEDVPFEDSEEPLLAAGSIQIVPPNSEHALVFDHPSRDFIFHESQLCLVKDNVLYDLEQGTASELPFEPTLWLEPGD